MGVAIDYLLDLGLDNIAAHEDALLKIALEKMKQVEGLRFIGG